MEVQYGPIDCYECQICQFRGYTELQYPVCISPKNVKSKYTGAHVRMHCPSKNNIGHFQTVLIWVLFVPVLQINIEYTVIHI